MGAKILPEKQKITTLLHKKHKKESSKICDVPFCAFCA